MESLEPIINVLAMLTVLSVMAERATNLLKLRDARLAVAHLGSDRESRKQEKERENAITRRGVAMGMLVALLLKADLFAILNDMQAPWDTLGWVHLENYKAMRTAASNSFGSLAYALAGCVLTGFALGFGSKFWHDVLGSVRELKNIAKNKQLALVTEAPPAQAGSHPPKTGGGEGA